MCGIIAIKSSSPVAPQLYQSLLALQHRGQDSAGIATFDNARLHLKKGVGLVEDVFSDENLALLKGGVGIGQVRYATIGASPKIDAQPLSVNEPRTICMAHNGNIVNYEELRSKHEPAIESRCDVEVILHEFSRSLAVQKDSSPESIFGAVKATMEGLNGSYSVVGIVGSAGLLAFRDPHAIRPLVMGSKQTEKGTDYAFASETVALDAGGFTFERDVKGGEAVFIDSTNNVHSSRLIPEQARHCMFEYVYFARPDSTINGVSVYEVRKRLGEELAEVTGSNFDVVVPVPDTSRTAASALADKIDAPFEEGLIKNRYVGRTFIMPTQNQRESAVAVKLNANATVLKGKRVLLVDDSLVRGTTARRFLTLVNKHAESASLALACPPIKHPCFYGVDFPIESELIAHQRSVEQTRSAIGAKSLFYLPIEGLRKAIGLPGLCTACLDGNYPTNVTPELKSAVSGARLADRKNA